MFTCPQFILRGRRAFIHFYRFQCTQISMHSCLYSILLLKTKRNIIIPEAADYSNSSLSCYNILYRKLLFTTNLRLNNGIEFNIHFLFLNSWSFYKNLFKEDRDPYIELKYTFDATDTPTPPSSLFCIIIIYGLHSSSMWVQEREKQERERERERENLYNNKFPS